MSKESEHNQSLRTEYSSVGEKASATFTRNWQATAFLVGGSFAAAGIMASRGRYDSFSLILTLALGFFIGITLYLFLRWQVSKDRWRQRILYEREIEIERELNLYTGRYFVWLDDKTKGQRPTDIPEDKNQELEQLEKKFQNQKKTGYHFIDAATKLAICIWPLLAFMQYLVIERVLCANTEILNCTELATDWWKILIACVLLVASVLSVFFTCRSRDPERETQKGVFSS